MEQDQQQKQQFSQEYPQQQYQQYPPPPPQYASSSTVVVTQPTFTHVISFREVPVRTKCQSCGAEVVTSTHTEVGTFAWVACLVVCFLGGSLGCCLIPFCVDGCKDVIHSCPNCRAMVGKYNRM